MSTTTYLATLSDEALTAVQSVVRAGAHDDARALYEELARWAPNRAAVWAGVLPQHEPITSTPSSCMRSA